MRKLAHRPYIIHSSDISVNAYFLHVWGGFWGFDPLNVVGYCRDPQKAHPWSETCVLAYRSCWSVKKCDLGAWRRKQNKNEKKLTDVTSHIFAQTTHVALSPPKLSY